MSPARRFKDIKQQNDQEQEVMPLATSHAARIRGLSVTQHFIKMHSKLVLLLERKLVILVKVIPYSRWPFTAEKIFSHPVSLELHHRQHRAPPVYFICSECV